WVSRTRRRMPASGSVRPSISCVPCGVANAFPLARRDFRPVEPMFAPVHNVPIYVAGYRTPMLELAGRKGDGYLARPLESLPSFAAMVPKIRRASLEAGRDERDVHVAGYLFALVDETRRDAINRAKRE